MVTLTKGGREIGSVKLGLDVGGGVGEMVETGPVAGGGQQCRELTVGIEPTTCCLQGALPFPTDPRECRMHIANAYGFRISSVRSKRPHGAFPGTNIPRNVPSFPQESARQAAGTGHDIEALATPLLRAKALGSSFIEALRASHKRPALAAYKPVAADATISGTCSTFTGQLPSISILAFDALVARVIEEEPYRFARRVFWVVDRAPSIVVNARSSACTANSPTSVSGEGPRLGAWLASGSTLPMKGTAAPAGHEERAPCDSDGGPMPGE